MSLEKSRKTKLERYGTERYVNVDKMLATKLLYSDEQKQSIITKIKNTKLAKYGEKLMSDDGLKRLSQAQHDNKDTRCAKIKKTKLVRYGSETYNNSEQMQRTKLVKYGDANYHNIEQMKRTNLSRYGVEFYSSSDECKSKVRQTCLEKFGYSSYLGTPDCIQKTIEFNLHTYGVAYSTQSDAIKAKTKNTCLEKYGTTYPVGHFSRARSYLEDEILVVLQQLGISYMTNNRTVLSGKEIDILLFELNKCIEIQGTYWHCDPRFYAGDYFHKVKSMYAKDIWAYDNDKKRLIETKGYKYHVIWEYDWKNDNATAIQKLKEFIYA